MEVAQFVNPIRRNATLRRVIETVTGPAVLILGRFTPESGIDPRCTPRGARRAVRADPVRLHPAGHRISQARSALLASDFRGSS